LFYLLGSPSVQVNATKEVILSAGSIGTTQILQLSGIGNPDDLNPLKIPVLVNSPKVGRNLMDHTFLPNIFSVNGETSLDHVLQDPNSINAVVNQFFTNHTGMIAAPVSNTFGFARIPANSTALKGIPDPAPGPNSPHFEYIPTVSY
jgi:choline dehydrogenase-like flavoprotein